MLDDEIHTLAYFHKDSVTGCTEIQKGCDKKEQIEKACDKKEEIKKDCEKTSKMNFFKFFLKFYFIFIYLFIYFLAVM